MWNLGCTREHFDDVFHLYSLSKAFPHRLHSHESFYSRQVDVDSNGRCNSIDMILRSSQLSLNDIALCLHYESSREHTFVLLHGCTASEIDALGQWLQVMKDHAGHPLLMAALFVDLHKRWLEARYRQLRVKASDLSYDIFGINAVDKLGNDMDVYRGLISDSQMIIAQMGAVDYELIELHLRLPDIRAHLELLARKCAQQRKEYMERSTDHLTNNLAQLERQLESLKAKNMAAKASAEVLIPSVSHAALHLARPEH